MKDISMSVNQMMYMLSIHSKLTSHNNPIMCSFIIHHMFFEIAMVIRGQT